jgi:predicted RND superfamily exporter protein
MTRTPDFTIITTILIIIIIIIIIIIQLIYLRANLTAQRPITKRARVEKKKIHIQTKYKSKAILIIIIIINKLIIYLFTC